MYTTTNRNIFIRPRKSLLPPTFLKSLWLSTFLPLNVLILCIPVLAFLLASSSDPFNISKHCTTRTHSLSNKNSCENTAEFVTNFFSALVVLCLIIIALGVSVLLTAVFEKVWGHCGWKGNRVGRTLRRIWGFGDGVEVGRERRVLNVLGSRVYLPDVVRDDDRVCGRCSEGGVASWGIIGIDALKSSVHTPELSWTFEEVIIAWY
ncbi:uncharacterized protein LY89DRAFT_783079 [Mollisia scopiformis]|uniref:Uncharacterized protein n=1 Tax=Mollisia scopiformis TaxID=149040 RepID=A0A194X6V1_MOLSC|nr:uncharacterized protein LY89DRAFT_783079 [Mollisia scopiformis]KUJ15809.1 hypothetical protein LY89DRAFT_783079 [Mollisia scopiformis]